MRNNKNSGGKQYLGGVVWVGILVGGGGEGVKRNIEDKLSESRYQSCSFGGEVLGAKSLSKT